MGQGREGISLPRSKGTRVKIRGEGFWGKHEAVGLGVRGTQLGGGGVWGNGQGL